MPISAGMSFLIILAMAVTTFITRAIPFLIFRKGKKIPDLVEYLGMVLTPGIIGMLVVYCLRDTPVLGPGHGAPEAIAVLVVVALHVWKRNNLLSIGAGTILYMILIQMVF